LLTVARQAKALGHKLKSQQKAESEEDDEEGDDKQQDKLWGANKRAYYDADVVDPEVTSLP
jgi:U3 small nucleolar RNA-associated protein 3